MVDTHWETQLSLGLWCVRLFSDVVWIANVCYFVVSVSFRYMYMHVHARRERTHVRMFGHPWLLLLCFGIVLLVDAALYAADMLPSSHWLELAWEKDVSPRHVVMVVYSLSCPAVVPRVS